MVQWLGLSVQRVQSLVMELRPCKPQWGQKKRKKKETNQIRPVRVINEQSVYLINLQMPLVETSNTS